MTDTGKILLVVGVLGLAGIGIAIAVSSSAPAQPAFTPNNPAGPLPPAPGSGLPSDTGGNEGTAAIRGGFSVLNTFVDRYMQHQDVLSRNEDARNEREHRERLAERDQTRSTSRGNTDSGRAGGS